jgi:tetratricopeptide (TPR) repeat protein
MAVALACPACSTGLRMASSLSPGQPVRCPRCSTVFPFPSAEAGPAKTESPAACGVVVNRAAPAAQLNTSTATVSIGAQDVHSPSPLPQAVPVGSSPAWVAAVVPVAESSKRLPRPWMIYLGVAVGLVFFIGATAITIGGVFLVRAALQRSDAKTQVSQQRSEKPKTEVARTQPAPEPRAKADPKREPKPVPQPDKDASAARIRARNWLQRTLVEDYDRVGKTSPQWNNDARQLLRVTAETWNRRVLEDRTIILCNTRLKRAQCSDPLVEYALGRLFEASNFNHAKTAVALAESRYHPAHRCTAWVRAALTSWLPSSTERNRDEALKLLPEAVAAPDVPDIIIIEICELLEASFGRNRKAAFDKIDPILAKGRPESSALYAYRGIFYTRYAWDARGGGWAKDVTPEGWQLMNERLAQAEAALEKAWQLDPTNARVATAMITVEMGQSKGRPRMEQWFGRAMQADPDNYDACTAKALYLEPKWHGSAKEMLEFGRDCLRDGNFNAGLPLILADAHKALSVYEKDPNAYFAAGVWEDIEAAYEPYLKARPNACMDRSNYMMFACRCGQWTLASQQLGELGQNVQPGAFGGPNQFQEMRRQIDQKSAWLGIGFDERGKGCKVGNVTADSPAAKAGVKDNDVITKVDGKAVEMVRELRFTMRGKKPGDIVTFEVRRGAETLTVKVTLGQRTT